MRLSVPLTASVIIMFLVATKCAAFSRIVRPRQSMAMSSRGISQLEAISSKKKVEESIFLDQVEESVARVLNKYDNNEVTDILELPPHERESLGVARNLNTRLQALARNNDCRRCWLQKVHCVCDKCPSLEPALPKVNRLFLLTHHKEICLAVDTAKLILAAFPDTCRLVVGGISSEYQDSMKELEEAVKSNDCLVLFPTDDARKFEEVERQGIGGEANEGGWDLIVVDGTWAQARKLHTRYLQNTPGHVQLSDSAVATLEQSANEEGKAGHQMRRHPIKWKQVSTLEATRLFLGDMMASSENRPWDTLALYQQIGDAATRKQLGPIRLSQKETPL